MCPSVLSRLLVRFVAFVFVSVGAVSLLLNILQSYRDFNPTYLLYYIERQFGGPLLLLLAGVVIFIFSKPLARVLAGKNRADKDSSSRD